MPHPVQRPHPPPSVPGAGLKSAAAKAPPKKATLLQHLAKATGLSLTQLKASFCALVLVVVVVCFFLASRAPAPGKQ